MDERIGAELPDPQEEVRRHPSDAEVVVAHVGNRVPAVADAVGADVEEDGRDLRRGDELKRPRVVEEADDDAIDFALREGAVDVLDRLRERQVPGLAVREELRDPQQLVAPRRAVELERDDDVRLVLPLHAVKYSILSPCAGR